MADPTATKPDRTAIYLVSAIALGIATIGTFVLSTIPLAPAWMFILTLLFAFGAIFAYSLWLRDKKAYRTAHPDTAKTAGSNWPAFLQNANPYERFLCLAGTAALVIGGIVGLSAGNAANDARATNDLTTAIGGIMFYDPDAGSEAVPWMWFGIVLAVLGAVMLIIFVSVRASKSK